MYSGIYLDRFESPQPRKLQSIAKNLLKKKNRKSQKERKVVRQRNQPE